MIFVLGACSTTTPNNSSSKLTQLTTINKDTVLDKGILIVDGSVDNSRVESMLADYAKKFNLDIEEVVYGSDWTNFENEQSKVSNATPSENSQKIESVFSSITDETLANDIYSKLSEALQKIMEDSSADISENCKYVAEKIGNDITVDNIVDYIKEAANSYSAVLTEGEIDPLNLPQLIVFNSTSENGRIQAFSEYPEEFAYLAAAKGLLNVEKTSTIQEVEEKIKNKETFVAVFTSSTCVYCYNTYPLLREKAAEYKVPIIEVNLASNKNLKAYDDFISAGYLTSEISGTPTTVYFKDGVLKDTQSGQMDVTKINSMFVRNK